MAFNCIWNRLKSLTRGKVTPGSHALMNEDRRSTTTYAQATKRHPRKAPGPRHTHALKRRDTWAHVPPMPTWTQEQTHADPRTSPMIQWGPILVRADRHALTNPGESIRRTHAHPRTYSHVYPKIRQHNTLNQRTSTTHVLAQKSWWWP